MYTHYGKSNFVFFFDGSASYNVYLATNTSLSICRVKKRNVNFYTNTKLRVYDAIIILSLSKIRYYLTHINYQSF